MLIFIRSVIMILILIFFFWSINLVATFTHIICEVMNPDFELHPLHKLFMVATYLIWTLIHRIFSRSVVFLPCQRNSKRYHVVDYSAGPTKKKQDF